MYHRPPRPHTPRLIGRERFRFAESMAKIQAVIRTAAAILRAGSLLCATLACCGCVLFPPSRSYQLVELPDLRDSKESGFSAETGDPTVLRAAGGAARVTAIRECDIDVPTPPLSRTRQLFVGFKEVKLPVASMLEIDGVPVQRTSISANLDEVPLSVVDYSFKTSECAFDIILWTPGGVVGAPDPGFEQSKQQLEAYLPNIVPSLTR